MRCLLLPLLIIFSLEASAQCKTFRISTKGETLDCVDMKGLKQGKWAIRVAPLRGNPGYEEEGLFINNLKEGTWRRFNLMEDLLAVENYRWGNKNGLCRYFTVAGLEREESWRAFNPGKAYDTLDVQDLKDPNKYEQVIVKTEASSLRHGTWKYYYPQTGYLLKSEKYILDKLQEPGAEDITKNRPRVNAANDTIKGKTMTLSEKPKPKEVTDFEKKTSGKKKKVRDGRTGG